MKAYVLVTQLRSNPSGMGVVVEFQWACDKDKTGYCTECQIDLMDVSVKAEAAVAAKAVIADAGAVSEGMVSMDAPAPVPAEVAPSAELQDTARQAVDAAILKTLQEVCGKDIDEVIRL